MKNLSSLILSYPLLNHDLTDCDCCCWQALLIVTLTSKDPFPIDSSLLRKHVTI